MTKPPWIPAATALPSPDGWRLCLFRYPHTVPLNEESRATVRRIFLRFWNEVLAEFAGFHPYALLQYNQLHLGNAHRIMSGRFMAWGMDNGLGYWPEREPPTLWTEEDFTNLDINEPPRPLTHQVFGINKGLPAIREALDSLLGIGPIVLTLAEDSIQKVKERATATFRPLIEEPALRMFAYYYPLLCARTFVPENADKLGEWTCGIHFFLRESPEENGIFIASRRPLDRVWQAAGGVQSEPGVWTWPSEPPGRAEKQD